MTYTAEQLRAMSDDELRRVIAELQNWVWVIFDDSGKSKLPDAVPNWPTDANAALALVDESAKAFELITIELGWRAGVVGFESPVWYFASSNVSPARAICEAWMLWKAGGSNK